MEAHSGIVLVFWLSCHEPIHSFVSASRAWIQNPRKWSRPRTVTVKCFFREKSLKTVFSTWSVLDVNKPWICCPGWYWSPEAITSYGSVFNGCVRALPWFGWFHLPGLTQVSAGAPKQKNNKENYIKIVNIFVFESLSGINIMSNLGPHPGSNR